MTTLTVSKLSSHHLSRKAIVYLRQSSLKQVKNNLESQNLQYALAERARDLGFNQVDRKAIKKTKAVPNRRFSQKGNLSVDSDRS